MCQAWVALKPDWVGVLTDERMGGERGPTAGRSASVVISCAKSTCHVRKSGQDHIKEGEGAPREGLKYQHSFGRGNWPGRRVVQFFHVDSKRKMSGFPGG